MAAVRNPEDSICHGHLYLIRPSAPTGGGGTNVEMRFCAVTSQGFQMFALNQTPIDGHPADYFWPWREIVDTGLEDAPPGHNGHCFRVMFVANGQEATLVFMEKGRDKQYVKQRVQQWASCIRAELDRVWAGRPAKSRSRPSKSARALGYATNFVMKTQAVPLRGAMAGKSFAESLWLSWSSTMDEMSKAMDFLAGKDDCTEFEDAASDSGSDISINSDGSDREPSTGRYTSEERAARARYLKEDQELLDMLDGQQDKEHATSGAEQTPKKAPAALRVEEGHTRQALFLPPARHASEDASNMMRIGSFPHSGLVEDEGADRARSEVGARRAASEINVASARAHSSFGGTGEVCVTGVGGRIGSVVSSQEGSDGWRSRDWQSWDAEGSVVSVLVL